MSPAYPADNQTFPKFTSLPEPRNAFCLWAEETRVTEKNRVKIIFIRQLRRIKGYFYRTLKMKKRSR